MEEGHKRRSIDEMIEHMNADFQSSDGQYIQLGFTPPTSVSPHAWSETFVPTQTSASQIHSYQPNDVRPVFLRDVPIQFKTPHQNLLHTIPHNVEVPPSFFHPHPSPSATSESMTCENHSAGLPYVNPGQPPRTLGGFVPYQTVPDHHELPPPRNYNLFGEGQVRLIRVADQSPNVEHWASASTSGPGAEMEEKSLRGKVVYVSSDPSPRQTELIDNLVGQWAPTSSGTYNPFGNQAGSGRTSNVDSPKDLSTVNTESKEDNGGIPIEKSKRRGVAETKVVRPSYSDVLSKTPPNKTHSSPSLVNKSMAGAAGTTSDGKGRSSTGGMLRNKNGSGRKGGLKRQYSSGSDEQVVSNTGLKLHLSPDGGTGLIGNKCGGQVETSKRPGETISRRWVSLDDLECGGEVEDSDRNENSDKDQREKVGEIGDMDIKFTLAVNNTAEYDRVKKGNKGFQRAKTGGLNQGCVEENADSLPSSTAVSSGSTTLSNYKGSAVSNSGGKFQSASGTKRPLHINNNLGTSGFWTSAGQLGGEKNVVKGSNSSGGVANSKNCKACSEERKATSASSGSGASKGLGGESGKTSGGGGVTSRSRSGGSASPGGGGQGAPQPPPPPPERTSREPQLGKRGQRNRRREGQQPFVALCRTARQHVIRWGSVILQALLWFLHLLSDILSLSSHLIWNICSTFWEWQGVTRRKLVCAFHDRFSPWIGAGSKGGANKKRTSSVGSISPKWWLCSWLHWVWKSSMRWYKKSNWKFRHWLGRRGWWGGISGENEDWDNDDGEDKDGGTFGGREKGAGRKGRGKLGFHHPGSLECNISLPSTGEEAMKRLLACKGKDPYSILGVTPNCSDDDVKKYYKRQAFLVHPDKNGQPGAEEAFKILVHAFDLIGEPEKRQAYDRRVVETQQAEHAWSEFSDLLSQLQEKMAEAANTIRCTNCGKRHRRISVPRPCYAARLCSQCKIHHAAREGDIWAESSMLGFLWHYYACMEGAIYDITEWAACQGDNLRHLRPNSHNVQYRILLGKRGGNGGNSTGGSPTAPGHSGNSSKPSRSSESPSEPDLDHFLNNLYSGGGGVGGNADNSQRQEQSRKRKGKRKK